ncbi:hypothetical protein EPUS_04001 [Endocarpon pusillum Z07020]|uniref:Uncharacterized protein n=1 Tax=Endocarpon pusillum (strain Z07020 / HMAS-L-300199) TaxID=1263415 RepID=U1FWR0_ENDPU|nr:uncharacterized protein EPUS_04001 [Endocarpon pusillum Z07020]ERF69297.1 hypothetical protein EPUS_04001 [Endocarpon pusillum Z07020]
MKPATKRLLVTVAVVFGGSQLVAIQVLHPDHDRIAETRRRLGIQERGAQQSRDESRRRVWRHERLQQDLGGSAARPDWDTTSRTEKGGGGGGGGGGEKA